MGSALVLVSRSLVGADAAFDVVFGVFVAAVVVLSAVTIRWAVLRDRAGRAQWLRRRDGVGPAGPGPAPTPNGRRPPAGTAGEREAQG